jgi:3-oxoadipate enol-lactonase
MTGLALHHSASGAKEGAPLLVAGSLGTTLSTWEPQLPALEERLRIVRIDGRGHGGSAAPPGPYEIADLGLERASWFGLSIGGMVGMVGTWLAGHTPKRIERLVLLCTWAHLPPASAWVQRAVAVREAAPRRRGARQTTPDMASSTAGSTEVVADAVVERWLAPPFAAAQPEVRTWLRGMLVATHPEGCAVCCEAVARMDLRGDVGRIRAATPVIGGEDDDPAVTLEHQRDRRRGRGRPARGAAESAAHLASVGQAGAVSRLVLDQLESA